MDQAELLGGHTARMLCFAPPTSYPLRAQHSLSCHFLLSGSGVLRVRAAVQPRQAHGYVRRVHRLVPSSVHQHQPRGFEAGRHAPLLLPHVQGQHVQQAHENGCMMLAARTRRVPLLNTCIIAPPLEEARYQGDMKLQVDPRTGLEETLHFWPLTVF